MEAFDIILMVVLALVALPAPTRGASDNTNLIQQILALVKSIQTILVGTDGSVWPEAFNAATPPNVRRCRVNLTVPAVVS